MGGKKINKSLPLFVVDDIYIFNTRYYVDTNVLNILPVYNINSMIRY